MSRTTYAATFVLGALSIALDGAWTGIPILVIGVIAVVEGASMFRASSRTTPRSFDQAERPLRGLASVAAGVAFVVIGGLIAAGVIAG